MTELAKQIETLADQALKNLGPESPATAWEMKVKLKVPLSHLYMALGRLLKDERVRVIPEGLSYRIHLPPVPSPRSSPVAGDGDDSAPFPTRQGQDKEKEPVIVPNLKTEELPSPTPNPEVHPHPASHRPTGQTVAKTVLGLAEVLEANGVPGEPEIAAPDEDMRSASRAPDGQFPPGAAGREQGSQPLSRPQADMPACGKDVRPLPAAGSATFPAATDETDRAL